MDYPEHTSEEERDAFQRALKAGIVAIPEPEEDFLQALLNTASQNMGPILVADPFTHMVKRVLAETVYAADCRVPPDATRDPPSVVADKQLYATAVEESRSFRAPDAADLHIVPGKGKQLVDLVVAAKVLVVTDRALHFYPQNIAYHEPDSVAIFLHVVLHLPLYMRAAIVHCCRSQGGTQEAYMELSYEQLWVWLVGEHNKCLPISAWLPGSGILFVDYMRDLWSVYEKAQQVMRAL
jgi:hypothetical protein